MQNFLSVVAAPFYRSDDRRKVRLTTNGFRCDIIFFEHAALIDFGERQTDGTKFDSKI